MSPLGDQVNPDPAAIHHFQTLVVSRLALEGAVVEIKPDEYVEGIRVTVSAPTKERLRYALGRLSAEFQIMQGKV